MGSMIKLTMSPISLPPSVDTSMQSMLDPIMQWHVARKKYRVYRQVIDYIFY